MNHPLHEFDTIPIIGHTRSWKGLKFHAQPVFDPHAPIDPTKRHAPMAWIVTLTGMRSDDFPCQMSMQFDALKVPPDLVQSMLKMFNALITHFETFRECRCLPNEPCVMHRHVVAGRPQ